MEKRYITLGDLIADLYYINEKLVGVDGGSSRFNVIANLASNGYKTALVGNCGNDKIGDRILKEYEELGVDTSDVARKDHFTRAYNLIVNNKDLPHVSYKCSKFSPLTHESTWYDDSIDEIRREQGLVKGDDVVVLDEINETTMDIINNLDNDKVLDIGNSKGLQKLSDEEVRALSGKLNYLQLNERVVPYLMDRFEFEDVEDVYKLLKPDLLTVTKGKDGADFFYDGGMVSKRIEHSAKELDPTGAGDAFFSVFIKNYFENDKVVDKDLIDTTFQEAVSLTSEVVKNVGARGHIRQRMIEKNKAEKENKDIEER